MKNNLVDGAVSMTNARWVKERIKLRLLLSAVAGVSHLDNQIKSAVEFSIDGLQ